jgi:hypothetical protein
MKIKLGLAITMIAAILLAFGCAEKGTPFVGPSRACAKKAHKTCYCGKLGKSCKCDRKK